MIMAGIMGWRVPARVLAGMALAAVLSAYAGPGFLSSGRAAAQERDVTLGQGVQEVTVAPNETMTLRTGQNFGDLVVGNAGMIDVIPLTDKTMFVRAKKIGATNISVYDDNKNLLGVIDVHVTRDLGEVRQAIAAAVPGSSVRVINSNEQIRLTGTVRNAEDLSRVMEIAQSYSPGQPVLNQLRVSDAQQVMLDVRMIEAKRTAGRDLGIGWNGASTNGTILRIGGGAAGAASTRRPSARSSPRRSHYRERGSTSSSTRWKRRTSSVGWRSRTSSRCRARRRASTPAARCRSSPSPTAAGRSPRRPTTGPTACG